MSYQRTVLSLVDTYAYLRDTFRELAVGAMLHSTHRYPSTFHTVLFDPTAFLTRLVQDINLGDQRPARFGGGSEVTVQMLVDEGVCPETARWLYHQAWVQITDQVAAVLPEASAGAESPWEYELSMGIDLVIQRWVAEPTEDSPQAAAMQVSQPIQVAPPLALPGTRLSPVATWLLEDSAASPPLGITSAEIEARFAAEYGKGPRNHA